jgi:phosphate-selective porin OprO/OprP
MIPYRTATALVALLAAAPLAQTPSNDDLAALVRQQAAEIAATRPARPAGGAQAPTPVAGTMPATTTGSGGDARTATGAE